MSNLSDTKRRLLERWNNPQYSKPALRRIDIGGGSGLRCLNNFSIEFRYPIVVIAGGLLNKDGYRYLQDYNLGKPQAKPVLRSMELGPRDRLSQAFVKEAEKGRTLKG